MFCAALCVVLPASARTDTSAPSPVPWPRSRLHCAVPYCCTRTVLCRATPPERRNSTASPARPPPPPTPATAAAVAALRTKPAHLRHLCVVEPFDLEQLRIHLRHLLGLLLLQRRHLSAGQPRARAEREARRGSCCVPRAQHRSRAGGDGGGLARRAGRGAAADAPARRGARGCRLSCSCLRAWRESAGRRRDWHRCGSTRPR